METVGQVPLHGQAADGRAVHGHRVAVHGHRVAAHGHRVAAHGRRVATHGRQIADGMVCIFGSNI